ncbi:BTB/POZ domain-containing protein KCTD14 isoform X1 [Panthera pardus]|uniref:BTB/POZ domain-containing protein KCTD14 isoform X1 n=1 Tax=Panthera pardus TaxID=9691 RepID=A0A9V1FM98_PANPR|nr:BTB/POZ domain-containing protein KCTD14 isoform X1 [Panthera pardus]
MGERGSHRFWVYFSPGCIVWLLSECIHSVSLLHSSRQSCPLVSPVVELNVGGELYTTTVSTLRKVPGSKLAEMFSSSTKACLDAEGRFFIDHPGTYFGPVLDYLRSEQLPTQHIPEVYREAQFYEIKPLVKLLEDTPQIFGEQVARKQFLLRVPAYSENLELMVRLARAEAVAARSSTVLVCVVRTEEEAAQCAEALRIFEFEKKSVVKFGPWKAAPQVKDLLDCVKMDIAAQGYQVYYEHYSERTLRAKYFNYFYTFLFIWW